MKNLINLKNLSNLICASLFTGSFDVNRNELIEEDDFSRVKDWYDSIMRLELRGIIFHNTFSKKTIDLYENNNVSFIRIDFDGRLNANVFRYLVYQDFIQQHFTVIDNLFVTDISDVIVLKNPFEQPFFKDNPDTLFCGDELTSLDNDWMRAHATHLRNSIPSFADYERENQNKTLLNCGIIGGNIDIMKRLMDNLAHIHRTYTIYNQTLFTLDMGAFNYVARTQFAHQLQHGSPINTQFKQYENNRNDCWFRHK